MRNIKLIIFFLLSLLLQTTIFPCLKIYGVTLDLLLTSLVILALFSGSLGGSLTGLVLGFLQDLLIGKCFGASILAAFLTGYFIGLFKGKVYKENPVVLGFFIFLGSICYNSILLTVQALAGLAIPSFWFFFKTIFLQGFLNVLLGILLFYPLSNLLLKKKEASFRDSSMRMLGGVDWRD